MNQRKLNKIENILYKDLTSFYTGDGLYVDINLNNVYEVLETKTVIISGHYGRRRTSRGMKEGKGKQNYFFDEHFVLILPKKESIDFIRGAFGEILWRRLDNIIQNTDK